MDLSKELTGKIKEDIVAKYALMLLSALNEKEVAGKIPFVKIMFLISKNVKDLYEESDFVPDNYGPNSDYVIDVYNRLIEYGIAKIHKGKLEITDLGRKVVELLKKEKKQVDVGMISDMKELCSDLTNDELLGLIYYTYPEMTTESLVRQEIEKKRMQIAVSLLRKGKISISKAAEIAGLSVDTFYKHLKKKGVKL